MGKRILSVVIALIAALGLIMAFEYTGGLIFEHPAVDMKDSKAISNMMASMSTAAFIWILLGYAVSAFAGGLIATLISGRRKALPATIVGAVLMVGGIMNLIMVPFHPVWFMISNLTIYLPFAWLGYFFIRKKA